MRIFTGTIASSGLAVGPVVRIDHGMVGLHRIVSDPHRERALYDAAIVLAKDELMTLQKHAQDQNDADILMFQVALLEDESFTNEIGDYIAAGAGSAAAVERAERIFADRIRNIDDDYLRERSVDVCDACRRVVDILDGRAHMPVQIKTPSILVSDLFYPSDLFALDRSMVLGLVSEKDSVTSHAAIMARSMGIPALCRVGEGTAVAADGHRAVLDAEGATLTVDPTVEQTAAAHRRQAQLAHRRERPDPLVTKPNRTRDGTSFTILGSANSSSPDEVRVAMSNGANGGIGLVRTESMILNGYDEERQLQEYRALVDYARGWPVVVRLCDPGADDGAPWVQTVQTLAARNSLYVTQVRALLQAGLAGPLCAVVPMICGVQGWDDFMQVVEECKTQLRAEGLPFEEDLPFGCMVEVPASALEVGEIISHGASFLYIDLDDLANFIYVQPKNEREEPRKTNTPVVKRLVRDVLDTAAANNTPVTLCSIPLNQLDGMADYMRLGARSFCVENAGIPGLKASLMELDLSGQRGQEA